MKEKLLYLLSSIGARLINSIRRPLVDVQRILVVKQDEIGDMVTALHVFDHLIAAYPDAVIEVQCKAFNRIFFKYMEQIHTINTASGTYDIIVLLRGDFKSLWFSMKHRPKRLVERGSIRMKNKFGSGQKNELDTNFEIIQPILPKHTAALPNTIHYSPTESQRVDTWLKNHQIQRFVVMHLGARDLSRRWPVERYQSLIQHLNERAYTVLLAGGPSDQQINTLCLEEKELKAVDIAGQFDLLEFSALCRRSSLFVGNESGPMHIAAAVDAPVVALFGPGVKDVFYPRGKQVKIHHYFLDKHHNKQNLENSTINRITVEEVIVSVDELLDEA